MAWITIIGSLIGFGFIVGLCIRIHFLHEDVAFLNKAVEKKLFDDIQSDLRVNKLWEMHKEDTAIKEDTNYNLHY